MRSARGGGNQFHLLLAQHARRVFPVEAVHPELARLQTNEIVGRCPRDDAVVVLWVLLRFRQPLPTARGTAAVIGVVFGLAVVGLHHPLAGFCQAVVSQIGEVIEAFGVAVDPVGVEEVLVRDVPGVRRAGGETAGEGCGHGRVVDSAGESPIAHVQQAAIPLGRQPDFEADFLADDAGHTAERRFSAWVRPGHDVEH